MVEPLSSKAKKYTFFAFISFCSDLVEIKKIQVETLPRLDDFAKKLKSVAQ
jgi:hypothetical protein